MHLPDFPINLARPGVLFAKRFCGPFTGLFAGLFAWRFCRASRSGASSGPSIGLATGLATVLTLAVMLCWAGSVSAQASAVLEFDNVEHESLYNTLIQEYRCLKCQNQNLASSSADLAGDLRREVYERVVAGMPREDIDQYLTDRYGDFVLYRPPFKPVTWLLWLGPFALLLVAVVYALRLSRQHSERQRLAAAGKIDSDLPPEKLAEARELLDRSR